MTGRRCVAPLTESLCGRPATAECEIRLSSGETVLVALCREHATEFDPDPAGPGTEDTTMRTTDYRIIHSGPDDLAVTLAHSAKGQVLTTSDHSEGRLAIIRVEDYDAATYLEELLEADPLVIRYTEDEVLSTEDDIAEWKAQRAAE